MGWKTLTASGAVKTGTVPTVDLAAATGVLTVPHGGTGAATLTGRLLGNGAAAVTASNINLASEVTGDLPFANLAQASAASKLLGRGSAGGAGDYQEVSLGTGLTMSGTTLDAATGTEVWPTTIIKSIDQVVTNDATFHDDTELFFTITAGEVWMIQLALIYSGNNSTGDFKGQFAFPTATMSGTAANLNGTDVANNLALGTIAGTVGQSMPFGTDSSDTLRVALINLMIAPTSTGTFKWTFANNAASIGRTSTTRAGSLLRGKRLF